MASNLDVPNDSEPASLTASQRTRSLRLPNAAGPKVSRPFTWQAAFIIALLGFWEGFPFALFGMPMVFGYQLYAGLCFIGVALYVLRLMRGFERPRIWEALPIILFIWCVAVSANYSIFIQPQELAAWLPAIFSVGPLLTIFLLLGIGATRNDAEQALYWGGMAGSVLVLMDASLHLNILGVYVRGSAFSADKIVFVKLTAAFGMFVALMRLSEFSRRMWLDLFAIVVMAYNVFIMTESRLAIFAAFLALVPIWFFVIKGWRKLLAIIVGPLIFIPVGLALVTRYIPDITRINDYLAQDVSATYRKVEADFFYNHFLETGGIGFGFMSGDSKYQNFLNFAASEGSQMYSDKYKGVAIGLVDIGVQSALYQYGYFGLILVLSMSLMVILTLTRSRSMGTGYMTTAALGWYMLALMVNPISVNYFTIFYTAHIGGLLWFVASRVSAERRVNTAAARASLTEASAERANFQR